MKAIGGGHSFTGAAMTDGDVVLENCLLEQNSAVVAKLQGAGATVELK